MADHSIRAGGSGDAAAIAEIYNHYVLTSVITFEEEAVAAEEMARRIAGVQEVGLPWIVAEDAGRVVGYAYAGPWKTRSAYRFTVESTVYLAKDCVGRGLGSALYGELFEQLKARGVHAVIGGAALPNDASVALQEKFGMQKVAEFREVGFKLGRWVNVGYWERVL
jgi:L-amino acid N-acyltransferase YncA